MPTIAVEKQDQIRHLVQTMPGASMREIARRVGVSDVTVAHYAKPDREEAPALTDAESRSLRDRILVAVNVHGKFDSVTALTDYLRGDGSNPSIDEHNVTHLVFAMWKGGLLKARESKVNNGGGPRGSNGHRMPNARLRYIEMTKQGEEKMAARFGGPVAPFRDAVAASQNRFADAVAEGASMESAQIDREDQEVEAALLAHGHRRIVESKPVIEVDADGFIVAPGAPEDGTEFDSLPEEQKTGVTVVRAEPEPGFTSEFIGYPMLARLREGQDEREGNRRKAAVFFDAANLLASVDSDEAERLLARAAEIDIPLDPIAEEYLRYAAEKESTPS